MVKNEFPPKRTAKVSGEIETMGEEGRFPAGQGFGGRRNEAAAIIKHVMLSESEA